jgi:galactokinase
MSTGTWAAPGRINLIGEHTDYNDGYVLPMALPHQVTVTAVRSPGRTTIVRSTQAPDDVVTFSAATVAPGDVDGWGAYVAGVMWAIRNAGHDVGELGLVIDSDVPAGAGLSSSAALECAVAITCNDMFGLGIDSIDLAQLAQRAENEFVGMPCGLMDQMISMHGAQGYALFLDTRSLESEYVPFDLAGNGLVLIVVDTKAAHELVGSEYADRRRDCEEAAKLLGVDALRDATVESVRELPDHVRARARHVVTENARVLDVVSILKSGRDLREIGPLLTESHVSLRDDFDVSVPETDIAVHALLSAGAYGARITGAGFGGSVIGLVDTKSAASAMSAVKRAFERCGFVEPSAFLTAPAAGARRIA